MRVIEVKGDSMLPILQSGQFILTKNATPSKLSRGDIVTFQFDNKLLIKRLVGLPLEKIEYHNGIIIVDDKKLIEPYLKKPRIGMGHFTWELSHDECIAIGDNAMDSLDSRRLGAIPINKIKDTLIFSLWPFGRIK